MRKSPALSRAVTTILVIVGVLICTDPAEVLANLVPGDIVVVDNEAVGGLGFIVRVDLGIPDDGLGTNQTIVSSGGLFFNPSGIAIVPIPEPGTIALLGLGGMLLV